MTSSFSYCPCDLQVSTTMELFPCTSCAYQLIHQHSFDRQPRPRSTTMPFSKFSQNGSMAQIRTAFNKAALRWHPDKVGPEAHEFFIAARTAYEVLIDVPLRKYHDTSVGSHSQQSPFGEVLQSLNSVLGRSADQLRLLSRSQL